MHVKSIAISALAASPLAVSAEQVLGVYIFHRHGDRTAKSWKPVNLTALGADEVHSSGDFYRKRYIDSDADVKINGVSSNTAVLSQLAVTSPEDAVLHNSALVFLQGLYPPTGQMETLANKTKIQAPLNGYQYVPVDAISDAASSKKSESNGWLQANSGCTQSEVSSKNYFKSPEFNKLKDDTGDFYKSFMPVINSTFTNDEANFKNAYTIFDYINVGKIHNNSDIVSNSDYAKLYNLASIHEWNLAYNSSDRVRAMAGSVLAGQIVNALEDLVNHEPSTPKFNVQFGAYGTFMSFFGLAQLPKVSPDFKGVCDYASSMAFELVTDSTDAQPSANDINVRFLFSNGTAADNQLKPFPLFGQDKTTLPWNDFKKGMADFSVADTQTWCKACGNNGGVCAANGTASADSNSSGGSSGVSRPVAGVIGALVTLVVILGVQALVMLIGGVRLVKKSALRRRAVEEVSANTKA